MEPKPRLSRDHRVSFRHGFFVTEKSFVAKPDLTKPAYSYFLRYRYRAPFRSDRVYHMKSIFVADRCLQAFNHYCDLHFEANNKKVGEIFVDTNIAYLHHYRDQAQDESFKDFTGFRRSAVAKNRGPSRTFEYVTSFWSKNMQFKYERWCRFIVA